MTKNKKSQNNKRSKHSRNNNSGPDSKVMLIDSTHSEETRVAVLNNDKLADFDYESSVRRQLKGSIFLAKVTRVEPSLQAAFVNFGGNRHGFLPFSEIHPDYFRIPIADREALLAEQEAELAARQAEIEAEEDAEDEESDDLDDDHDLDDDENASDSDNNQESSKKTSKSKSKSKSKQDDEINEDSEDKDSKDSKDNSKGDTKKDDDKPSNRRYRKGRHQKRRSSAARNRNVEVLGGDSIEGEQPLRPTVRKHYKIQEVVKRGQIMLVQASKEERGNKGAAVTSYLSLPGRYCVLMPNSPRAGGVSRKIANYKERKRMREVLAELEVPTGMSVIMRTAGVERTKAEIKRDLDYLIRLWNKIRETTLTSSAPAVIHEEGNLIRRAIRDVYTRDVEEIQVAGDRGHKIAKDFMKMLIPSHAKKVIHYQDEMVPLFHKYKVEKQISDIGTPEVVLPSGGYLVIHPTEALVSVDVNSGRATKERHIEETALKTNLEAADEVARQLRLRDLGGLVVIDFIDMEDRRNNRKVEQRLKEALSGDRARIQIGRISSFGLLELSRQRLNPSITEAQFVRCSHCDGVGSVRSTDATTIMALRALEEAGIAGAKGTLILKLSNDIAVYMLNKKRHRLADIEKKYDFHVDVEITDSLGTKGFELEESKSDDDAGTSNDNGNKSHKKHHNHNNKDSNGDDNNDERNNRRKRSSNKNNNNNNKDNRGNQKKSGGKSNHKPNNKDQDTSDDKGGDTSSKQSKSKSDQVQDKKDETKKTSKSQASPASSKNSSNVKSDDKSSHDKDVKKSPVKKSSSKTTKKTASKKADTKSEKDETKKAQAKEKKTEDKKSDDTFVPANENPAKKYETVNKEPETKKKGWWNKLVE